METFNLSKYETELRAYMSRTDKTPEQVVSDFITNLAVMKEQYPFSDNLNFHTIGQAWNRLMSDIRIQQRQEAVAMLQRSTRRRE